MPRAGLSTDSVVEAAAELADQRGLGEVTVAALADRLGVRAPSLYAHVRGLGDLRARLAVRGAEELAAALATAAAGRSDARALGAIADAYRAYAHAHPGSYEALQRIPQDDPRAVEAARAVLAVVLAVLAGYGLDGDDALHAARTVRSALHGFVSLEATYGFGMPLDLDQSFSALVATLDRGLRTG